MRFMQGVDVLVRLYKLKGNLDLLSEDDKVFVNVMMKLCESGQQQSRTVIVFFVNKRLAFDSKVRLKRHIEKFRALGIKNVIDARYYPSKKSRHFKTIR